LKFAVVVDLPHPQPSEVAPRDRTKKRHLSEAIPSTERLNSREDDAVQVNGEGSAALADGDEKIPEEVPSVSRYGRKRTAKKRC
jgi:hypothetical protein